MQGALMNWELGSVGIAGIGLDGMLHVVQADPQ
jgi:hypothetical protein